MSAYTHHGDCSTSDPCLRCKEFGETQERERIIVNVRSRVADLRACTKRDNCQELATLIESYIPEWTERATE